MQNIFEQENLFQYSFFKELFLFLFSSFMNRSFDQWTIRLISLSELNLLILEKSKLDTKITH